MVASILSPGHWSTVFQEGLTRFSPDGDMIVHGDKLASNAPSVSSIRQIPQIQKSPVD